MHISNLNFNPTLNYYADKCKSLDGSRILITGATGFVGKWLVESLIQISREFKIKIEIVVVTRDLKKTNDLFSNHSDLSITELDLTSSLPNLGAFTHVIHAASPTTKTSPEEDTVMEASLATAKNLIASFKNESNTPRFIHTSSGAVYGTTPLGANLQSFRTRANLIKKPETFLEEYQNAKIKTEEFIEQSNLSGRILGINARLFAFYGPYLSINSHYAIGNFMQSVITRKVVEVKSMGESYRSYMHASELACQVIYLMSSSELVNCDIGSDFSKPISWWANYIGELFDSKVKILGELEEVPTYYVPNTNSEIPKLDYANNNMDLLFIQWFDWLKINLRVN